MSFFLTVRAWCGEHKKMTATILSLLAALIPTRVIDEDTKTRLVAGLVAYIIGQGIADVGKEKTKIQAEAMKGPQR